MTYKKPSNIQRVAVIGAGTIGAGWAALFLARGLAVSVYDPDAAAEARLCEFVAQAWPFLQELGLTKAAAPEGPQFTSDLEAALFDAQFVQESAPEDEALKAELIGRIDATVTPDVVIASSSSAFLVSALQQRCRHPGRVVLGHPFHPPHLVPLVEVAGGERTDPVALDWAMAFYRTLGQRPVGLRHEIYRHVANRLQSVLWNEAVRLVEAGVADPAEIDAAVTDGPGLRWAVMGPFLSHHLGGGRGGLAKALSMFGDPQQGPADHARRMELTAETRARLLSDLDAVTGGRDIIELENARDRALVAIRKARAGR